MMKILSVLPVDGEGNDLNAMKASSFARCSVLYSCLLLVAGGSSWAETRDGGTLSLYLENDLFGGTDRYYTSGAKMSWSSANIAKFSDSPVGGPLLAGIESLPFGNSPAFQKNLLLSIGQNIYTPDDKLSSTVIPGDRPYAGWLYGEIGMVWKNAKVRNTFALDVGVVGPWALGRQTQKLVHSAQGYSWPKGWGDQLHNELGVLAVYERTWRWPMHPSRAGLNWEILPQTGASIGNVRTSVSLGSEIRIGLNLPDDFGSGPIEPGEATPTPVQDGLKSRRAKSLDFGVYVFGRVNGRLVAHNVFLDGNTFGTSPSVDRKKAVADLSVGAAINYRNSSLTYALIYRTKEFSTQKGDGQVIGSVSLNMHF
jgi:hypothetical protein